MCPFDNDSGAQPREAGGDRETRSPGLVRDALETFGRQVLVFPLLVVVLACASFLFGGRCATWQWWTAVTAVVAAPFVRKNRRRAAVGAAGLFAVVLFALKFVVPLFVWDSMERPDLPTCHLPMIQLLIEGWNPVSDPTAEGITASLGLDLWGMAPLHVAFSMKTLAVFSAVAFAFVGDPHALTFPLLVFLWLGVLLAAVRMFRGFARWALVAALVFVLPMVAWRMPVDLAMAFASCGLLLTMLDALRRKECDWIALAVWGAWMTTLKLNGALGLAIFAAAFAVAKIRKERGERKRWAARFAAWIAVVAVVAGIVSWNPLGTSWRTFGHPLYPYQTVDAERFPVQNLAWDLQNGNDDFRSMGRVARLAHAYLSPQATVALYRTFLRRPDFEPECEWWKLEVFPDGYVRAVLWLMFGLLLFLPAGRPFGIGGLLLLAFVPDAMVGYTRYQPWLSALGCLAVALAAERAEARIDARLVRGLSAAIAALLFIAAAFKCPDWARNAAWKANEISTVRERIRPPFWGDPKARYEASFRARDFAARYNYLTCMENRTKLLVRQLGREGTTVVEPAENWRPFLKMNVDWDERNWHCGDAAEPPPSPPPPEKEERWEQTPFGYWVPTDGPAGGDGGLP